MRITRRGMLWAPRRHDARDKGMKGRTVFSMRKLIRRVFNVSPIGIAHVIARLRRPAIVPYRNVHLRLGRDCEVTGPGRLSLGVRWPGLRYMPSQMAAGPGARIVLGGAFAIYSGFTIWVHESASLSLGSGYINSGLNLWCFHSVEIGSDVQIGEGVTIRDSDNHYVGDNEVTQPITIGDHVWIGMNATILKGVTIGEGAVVAAGAVVTRDVPARALVAGVPAIVKKTGVMWVG
jgi:acetyltransferase-like isoleucine patch superfamily enzyme